MEWVTTTTLLHDLRATNQNDAWDVFVRRFHRPIVSFVCGMGIAVADSDDVAQESLLAFVEAYRSGKYDRSKGRLSKWLFGIVYHQALRQRRRYARQEHPGSVAIDDQVREGLLADEAATNLWQREWNRWAYEECLERVRSEFQPQTFEAFELVVLRNRTPESAASELNVPVKMIYNAKHRVLGRVRQLREELEEAGDEALPRA